MFLRFLDTLKRCLDYGNVHPRITALRKMRNEHAKQPCVAGDQDVQDLLDWHLEQLCTDGDAHQTQHNDVPPFAAAGNWGVERFLEFVDDHMLLIVGHLTTPVVLANVG